MIFPAWRPIETAPKDGTKVLLFYPGPHRGVCVGVFIDRQTFEYGKLAHRHQYWYTRATLVPADNLQPTHWMPLPAPPGLCSVELDVVPFTETQTAVMGLDDGFEKEVAASAWAGEAAPSSSAKAASAKASKRRAAKRRRPRASRTKAPALRRRKGGR